MKGVVRFVVEKSGKVTAEAEGFTGTSCEEFTNKFLGLGRVVFDEKKPEYYAASEEKVISQEGGG